MLNWIKKIFSKEKSNKPKNQTIESVSTIAFDADDGPIKKDGDVWHFKKGSNYKLSDNFLVYEMDCKCEKCSVTIVNIKHIELLQKLRTRFKAPIFISSGYRCEFYNKAIGGAKKSRHMEGDATDIQVAGMKPSVVQDYCTNFDGLGRYKTFTHIDSRGYRARW